MIESGHLERATDSADRRRVMLRTISALRDFAVELDTPDSVPGSQQ